MTDLRDLFARHAHQSDPTESAWFVAEPELAEVEPIFETEGVDDLIRFGVEELGGLVVETPESIEREPEAAPRLSPLPPRKRVRRHKPGLMDAPQDEETPLEVPNWPVRQPEPVPVKKTAEVRQLALF